MMLKKLLFLSAALGGFALNAPIADACGVCNKTPQYEYCQRNWVSTYECKMVEVYVGRSVACKQGVDQTISLSGTTTIGTTTSVSVTPGTSQTTSACTETRNYVNTCQSGDSCQ